ncbi:hypothetical protein FZI91_00120 [Mycobacterium sp. CBMA271]|uniref:hypothetical protein n=1 Tax=unclassified Mycobacteroides TaxID=2618759 RepID=UPI0012DF52B2|nr:MULTISPECIES: hypothetical protein [unclassified Mycobacteroides]MUM20112.1 hypothetical protein [Mycobacteroides sp. CBMA 271]
MTLHVDQEALDRISTSLSDAGKDLDGVSGSAPASVDGGLGTPAILGILGRIVENAGQLVVAVEATGEAVAAANSNYRTLDEAAAEPLNQIAWRG